MITHIEPRGSSLELSLLALEAFQVLFLLLHDWIPLGRLNNVSAVQSQDTRQRLVVVTILSSIFFVADLSFCLLYFGQAYPRWLYVFLWITYSGIFMGQLRAWWVPYLLWPDARRAARYQAMFGNTHSFLPVRNGITPNTLHVIFHLTIAATLIILFAMEIKA
jgi:hypothetical protein